jgi:hypothetical protein
MIQSCGSIFIKGKTSFDFIVTFLIFLSRLQKYIVVYDPKLDKENLKKP